jgi:alginate O-acetyltransferase complex protein AlgI
MLFTSLSFAVLLAVTILAARLAPGGARRWVLLLASWAFYAGWEPKWLLLLWISTAVDYAAGRLLAVEARAARSSSPASR